MAKYKKQSGISLTEILVVIAVMAILMGVSIPAAKQLASSFESGTGVRQLINAALSNARAIAVRNQTYAGVRFQQDKDGNTYLIFIVHDKPATGLANGFRTAIGRKPMKLPEDVGVLSGYWIDRSAFDPSNWSTLLPNILDDTVLTNNPDRYLLDASTFSIVFSPQGKLTVHAVWVRRASGNDTIFNIEGAANLMFLQDDYDNYGIGPEMSVQSFLIYSKSQYQQAQSGSRWSDYLQNLYLNREYISPYTGELVMEYREQTP